MENLNQILIDNLAVVVLVVGAVAVVALLLAVANVSRVGSISRRFAWVRGDTDASVDTLDALLRALEKHGTDITSLKSTLEQTVANNRSHLQHVGLIRYDAFDGLAGQQSYSLCMLDDKRDGVLISNLVGRDFSRSYAIEIVDGQAPRKLGDEEAQALAAAATH